jgi:predicted Ser/Thr protein kinase
MAAAELDKKEATAFLEAACADDEALRLEVESLLAHHVPETLLVDDPKLADTGQLVRPAFDGELLETPGGTTGTDLPRKTSDKVNEPERFAPGTIIAGRYRILGLLGRGGMGEVYRADDLRLEQPVALKFLAKSRSADEEWLARFHGEVRLARRVTHANVNRVYDIGEADGEVFLSMEFVDGENLASLLRRIGRLPIERALRMARELCAGLGAAHDQGVLHRDLKPANVMVDGLGHVRIMDFGIAVAKSDSATVGPAGTLAYMAPELFEGGEASVASDIYSLGVVLYEMVTGKLPFDRTRKPEPSALSPISIAATENVTPQLERVIRRCLAPDPQDRPRSIYAVLSAIPGGDALAAAVASGETPSPEMVAAAAEEPADRRSLVALLMVAVLALGGRFLTRRPDHAPAASRSGEAACRPRRSGGGTADTTGTQISAARQCQWLHHRSGLLGLRGETSGSAPGRSAQRLLLVSSGGSASSSSAAAGRNHVASPPATRRRHEHRAPGRQRPASATGRLPTKYSAATVRRTAEANRLVRCLRRRRARSGGLRIGRPDCAATYVRRRSRRMEMPRRFGISAATD